MKNIYEVFDEIEKASTTDQVKTILSNNNSFALRMVLRANYHPNIRFVIDKIPDYRPSDDPPGLSLTTLHKEINKIYLFEENNPSVSPNLTLERKKVILIQLLEALEAREASVLSQTIMKSLSVKNLTKELVLEVFPGLLD